MELSHLRNMTAEAKPRPSCYVRAKVPFSILVRKSTIIKTTWPVSDRFFIQYHNGRCIRENIGRYKIGEVPESIASYLNLENAKKYTGHSFRRTAATLHSASGANMQMIKQLGRWRSDMIAQGYIENSLLNKQLIYNGITHEIKTSNSHLKPSTSKEVTTTTSNSHSEPPTSKVITSAQEEVESNYHLDWSDFFEDFSTNNLDPNPGKHQKYQF